MRSLSSVMAALPQPGAVRRKKEHQQGVLEKQDGQIANCAWQYVDVAEASGLSAGYDAASRAAKPPAKHRVREGGQAGEPPSPALMTPNRTLAQMPGRREPTRLGAFGQTGLSKEDRVSSRVEVPLGLLAVGGPIRVGWRRSPVVWEWPRSGSPALASRQAKRTGFAGMAGTFRRGKPRASRTSAAVPRLGSFGQMKGVGFIDSLHHRSVWASVPGSRQPRLLDKLCSGHFAPCL